MAGGPFYFLGGIPAVPANLTELAHGPTTDPFPPSKLLFSNYCVAII